MDVRVVDKPDASRYEAYVGVEMAGFAAYRIRPDAIVFTHAEVDDAFEGKGVGTALARGALDDVRARGLRIVPLCPFIAAFIRRHDDYRDLIVERYLSDFDAAAAGS